MRSHSETREAVISQLKTDVKSGLTLAEVKARQEKFGENKLKEKKKKSNLQRFFEQFKDAMIIILIVAAIISFVIACVEGNPKNFSSRL